MRETKKILTTEENAAELSERSVEIDVITQAPELREIVTAIKHTMEDNELLALSAPQIGYKRRIFCIRFKEEIKTFVNPIIADAKENSLQLSRETTPSIPGKEYIVPRNNNINVMYQRPLGQPQHREMIGLAAFTYQRMMQYLDGVWISDIGLEVLDGFDEASEEEKNEIIHMYLDSLDLKLKDLNNEIQSDPDLKALDDGIKYMESVFKGETEICGIPANGENKDGNESSENQVKEK